MNILRKASVSNALILVHSTYRLQLLDVSLFTLMSTAYTKELKNYIFKSDGIVLMTKCFFYPLFQTAFHKASTQENIKHAFEKIKI
jgi:hypothetical protein